MAQPFRPLAKLAPLPKLANSEITTSTSFDPLSDPYIPPPTSGGGTTSGGGQGGGGLPNFQDLINSLLGPLRAQLSGESIADAASRRGALQRAYVQFGETPDLALSANELGLNPEFASDITDETRALARQATTSGLSTLARLNQARSDAIRLVKNTLAGRGLFHSGETGFQLGRAEQAASRNQYDERLKLLDYFAGVQSAFANAERERARLLAQAGLDLFGQIPWGSFGGGGGGAAPAAQAAAPPAAGAAGAPPVQVVPASLPWYSGSAADEAVRETMSRQLQQALQTPSKPSSTGIIRQLVRGG